MKQENTPDKTQGLRSVGASAIIRLGTFPITAAATFLTTSLVISYAGPTGYAAIAVIITLSQLVPYADLGIGAGVINAISMSESGDSIRLKAMASAVRLLLISSMVVSAVGFLGSTVFSWSDVLSLGNSGLEGIDPIVSAVILVFGLTIPLGIGQRVLLALMLNPVAVMITALIPVLSLAGTACVIAAKLPAGYLALPPVFSAMLGAVVALVLATLKLRFRLHMLWQRKNFRLKGLIGQGIWYLVLSVVSAIAFQFGRIILATVGSLADVASFSMTMQFYAPLWSFFIVAGTALWPIFARNRAQRLSQTGLLLKMTRYFVLAAMVSAVGLVVLGPWLSGLISNDQVSVSTLTLICCGALVVAQSVQLVIGVSLTSPQDLRFQALWGIPMALAVVTGTWFLGASLGSAAPFLVSAAGVMFFQVLPSSIRTVMNERHRRARSDELDTRKASL